MSGISQTARPPVKWSENENIKWKIPLTGDGSNSSPIVWSDKIFFQTAVQTGSAAAPDQQPAASQPGGRRRGGFGSSTPASPYKFNIVCLDRKTGKLIWQKTVKEEKPHQGHHADHGFASFSPVTDGKLLWANFGSRGIHCYDTDGNKVWSKDLVKMTTRFGEGSSPAIAGDLIIVTVDHEGDSFIAAYDKKTGDVVWKKSRDEETTYATPFVVTVNGKMQVVANATNNVTAYDAKTGEIIWQCSGQTRNVVPTPVTDNELIYCTSGFRGSCLQAIKLGKTGDLSGTDAVAWQVNQGTPYVPSPLYYKGRVYVFNVNNEDLSCYEAKTGRQLFYREKLDEMRGVYASPAAADGKIYLTGRNGVVYVIKPSDKLEVIAVNRLDDSIDCSPAFVDNEIIIKGKKHLYCISE